MHAYVPTYIFRMCAQARDASGSTAVVAVVTPQHVIVANSGDSRAILIMIPSRGRAGEGAGAGAGGGTGGKRRGIQWHSGRSHVPKASCSFRRPNDDDDGDNEKKDEKAAAAVVATASAQRFTSALGLKAEGEDGSGSFSGGDDDLDGNDGVNTPDPGDAAGLNDSVRLEEMEEDDSEEGGDIGDLGLDDADAAKIRELLSTMMLGDSAADSCSAVGADADEELRGDGAGAQEKRGKASGSGNDRGVEILALSRDHTASDEMEKQRVEAAGGRTFEVRYTEEDGTEAMVRESL